MHKQSSKANALLCQVYTDILSFVLNHFDGKFHIAGFWGLQNSLREAKSTMTMFFGVFLAVTSEVFTYESIVCHNFK